MRKKDIELHVKEKGVDKKKRENVTDPVLSKP